MTDLLGPASAPNAVTARLAEYRSFGAADTWFKPCTNPASQDGTQVQAAWLNGITAQLRAAIRGNGNLLNGTGPVVPENNTADAMLLTAVQLLIARGQPNCAADTGSADALVAAPATAWPEYVEGARLWLVKSAAAGANATPTPTVAVSGLAPLAIVKRDGSALAKGDLPPGAVLPLAVHNGAFRIVDLAISDVLSLTAATPVGKTLKSWSAAGTYSFVVPSKVAGFGYDVTQIYGVCVGGGAGGSGAANGGTTNGAGGGAGGTAEGYFSVTPGQTLTLVVGSGSGGAPYGALTANAQSSSIGSVMAATGGGGVGNQGFAGGPGGVGSGGQTNLTGGAGGDGNSQNPNMPGGMGGASSLGGGGRAATAPSYITNGQAPGSGGGGIYGSAAANAGSGGRGADGYISLQY